jgi:high-affinity iron transporter
MFESLANAFLISFREGIEAALIVMTVLVVVGKRNDKKLKTVTLSAVVVAVVVCSVLAFYLGTIALVNNVELEVTLYGAAALAVLTMVFWMMRHGKALKSNIEAKVNHYSSKTTLFTVIGLFLFVFFMVAREGFELALFLLAFGSGVGGGFYIAAMLAGLAAAIGIGMLLSKGIVKVNIGKFLQLTSYVLLILVVQLVMDFLHEGMEAGIVPEPASQSTVNTIDYLSHDLPIFSYIAMIGFFTIIVYTLRQSYVNSAYKAQPAITAQH